MFNRRFGRAALYASTALAVFAAPVAAIAQAQAIEFNIPAQNLGAALRAFGLASHQSIIFSEDDVRGKTSPALVGAFSPEDALAKLLDGSGLVVRRTGDGVIYLGGRDQVDAAPANSVKEVVVTARRAAIQNATLRKKDSDTVIDSVVADEAGKLPDTSVTEVLQRVTGVTISRFASLGSPDQFSFEGSGVQVRGLSGVTGLLNGREIFSANGGSGLNWGDVTPELMAAVDVYKASTADLIEGGTGGAIDLRTRMPFDYKKPEVDLSLGESYGDFSKRATPSASVLLTDRWQTPVGDFGALVDLSYSQFRYSDSFVRAEPYYQTTYQGAQVFVPGGFDYGNDGFNRVRKGFYAAFQWRPTDNLTLWQTDFASNYHQSNVAPGVFAVDDESDLVINGVFNKKGVFQSGLIEGRNGNNFYPGNNDNATPSDNTTADFSQGFIWNATDRLKVQGAVQVVESGAYAGDFGLGIGSAGAQQESLNFTGALPHVGFNGTGGPIADPTQAGIDDLIWNRTKNHAQMVAENLDAEFRLGDGFFKKIKAGVRYADRYESDSFVGTWWSPTGRGWNGIPQAYVSNSPASDFTLEPFHDFFKGRLPVPSPYWNFRSSVLTDSNLPHFEHYYASCSPSGTGPTFCSPAMALASPYDPLVYQPNSSKTKIKTTDVYLVASFGSERLGFLPPFTGNLGLRVVNDRVSSTGSFNFNGGLFYYPTAAAANADWAADGGAAGIYALENSTPATPLMQIFPGALTSIGSTGTRTDGMHYMRALPSLNVNFKPGAEWVIRVAVNQTLSPPNYSDIRATGSAGVNTIPNPNPATYTDSSGQHKLSLPGIFNGFSYNSGDTRLKPAVSTNEDLSVEWYPKPSTTAHIDVFNKDLKDMIIYNDFAATNGTLNFFPSALTTGGSTTPISGAFSGQADFNAGKTSTIRGVEIGGRTYFDMLPGWAKGFGIESNFTYIDSNSPSALAFDMQGNRMSKIPIVGLSKYNYNIILLYDLGKWDARLAYSYRSKYLASTTGNGTTGSYAINGGTSVNYSLPVYGAAIGTLDGSVSYKFTEHLSLSIDGANLLDNISKTQMEIMQGVFVTRSWFLNDRRVSATLHASF